MATEVKSVLTKKNKLLQANEILLNISLFCSIYPTFAVVLEIFAAKIVRFQSIPLKGATTQKTAIFTVLIARN